VKTARAVATRVLVGPMEHWHLLLALPPVSFVVGALVGSLELLLIATPLMGFVAMYCAVRLILLLGGHISWALIAGFPAFVVVGVLSLVWMYGDARPWMVATAGRRALQEELLQVCIDQRLDGICTTPACRASSYEEAEDSCVDDWRSGCSTLGEPGLDVDTLPDEMRQYLDSQCMYFRIHQDRVSLDLDLIPY